MSGTELFPNLRSHRVGGSQVLELWELLRTVRLVTKRKVLTSFGNLRCASQLVGTLCFLLQVRRHPDVVATRSD
jgi:hypothetical protein